MENITEQMLDQDDIKGRLRLFRYGLIVIVVVAFLLSWLMPYAMFQRVELENTPGLFDNIDIALIVTGVVAVLMVVAYFAYAQVLKRSVAK